MQDSFGTVIVVVVIVSAVVAGIAFAGARKLYDQIGRGGLSIGDEDNGLAPRPAATGAVAAAEREDEIRQLLSARNVHRERRGEARPSTSRPSSRRSSPLSPTPGWRREVRQLVLARNTRRERQGKPPLDVEAEVARQLRDLA